MLLSTCVKMNVLLNNKRTESYKGSFGLLAQITEVIFDLLVRRGAAEQAVNIL